MRARLAVVDSIRSPEFRTTSQLAHDAGRRKYRRYLIEGENMLRAALKSGAPLKKAFVAGSDHEDDALVCLLLGNGVETFSISQGMLFKMLGTSYKTSIRYVGVVEIPQVNLGDLSKTGADLLAIGEEIQDPRNVGVLIRTAEASGAGAILFTGGSADPWSRASVRSTTGSILRLPVMAGLETSEAVSELKSAGYSLIATSASAAESIWQASLPEKAVFVFGNESRGISDQARQCCDTLVRIPIQSSVHSLNVTVAAGVALFEWSRTHEANNRDK